MSKGGSPQPVKLKGFKSTHTKVWNPHLKYDHEPGMQVSSLYGLIVASSTAGIGECASFGESLLFPVRLIDAINNKNGN
jgi:hypothetical protein